MAFFAFADLFLDTILPSLFFARAAFVKPLDVFSLCPANTEAFAREPFAITLTLFAFFMAIFIAAFFMAGAFMADFMALPFFIAATFFMGTAIPTKASTRPGQ